MTDEMQKGIQTIHLELSGEGNPIEEIDLYQVIYNRYSDQEHFFLETGNGDPINLSHRIKPGDKIISLDLDTKERNEYNLTSAKEGILRFALTSGSSVNSIIRTLATAQAS